MNAMPVIRSALRQPLARRTWREVAYALTSLLPAIPAFALAVVGFVACLLSVVAVGLPLLAVVLLATRSAGALFRRPARAILDWDWTPPRPLVSHRTRARLTAALRDPAAWRGLLYCFVKLPLTAVTVYGAVVAVAAGTFGLAAPLWWFASHDGWGIRNSDSWSGTIALAAQAAAVLLVFPWFVRFLVVLDHSPSTALLAPTPDSQRVASLERSRRILTNDAAATLARVERDLHDGTQARFVTLGLTLSRLEPRIDDSTAREILATARRVVDDGLEELRDIIRGMHPPALNDGLATALATLASRSPVPTAFHDHLHTPPPPATADALYFAAAELLTNIARHANASRADLTIADTDSTFRLTVTDDGHGGANDQRGRRVGTGLCGLRERAEALDGSLEIDSPATGPTIVVMTIPKVLP